MRFLDFEIEDKIARNVAIIGIITAICVMLIMKTKSDRRQAEIDFLDLKPSATTATAGSGSRPASDAPVRVGEKGLYVFEVPAERYTYRDQKKGLDIKNSEQLKKLKSCLQARASKDFSLAMMLHDTKKYSISSGLYDNENIKKLEEYLENEWPEVEKEANELQANWGNETLVGADGEKTKNEDYIFSKIICQQLQYERGKTKNHLKFETW